MMVKRYTLLVVLFLMIKAGNAQNSMIPNVSYPYLDQLIAAAKSHYPRAAIFKDRTDLAQANITRAKLAWFDIFTLSYIYQPSSSLTYNTIPTTSTGTNSRYLFNGFQAGVSLNIGNVIAKPAGIKLAKENFKIANEEQDEYLITLTADVKRKYFTYLLQQNLIKLQTQAEQDMQNAIQQARYKFQKGEITFDSYNAMLVSAALRTEQKLQAEANFLIAKSDLEAVIGIKLEDVK